MNNDSDIFFEDIRLCSSLIYVFGILFFHWAKYYFLADCSKGQFYTSLYLRNRKKNMKADSFFNLIAILTFLYRSRCETISCSDSTYSFTLTQLTTYTPNYSSNGVPNPSNYLKELAISVSNTYILDADSCIQVYSRTDPTIILRYITDYQFSPPIKPLSHVVYSLDESMVLMVRSVSNTISYSLYSINGNIWTFQNITVVSTTLTPQKITMRDHYIFTFNVNMTGDVVHVIDYTTGLISNISLGVFIRNYSVNYTPDRQKAIIWSNSNTQFQVRTLDTTFTLLYSDNSRLTSTGNVPKNISFSADSQLAIIQYDGIFPTIIFNLTDYSIVGSITVETNAYSAFFLDNSSRFVFIQTDLGDHIYDIQNSYSSFCLLNSTLPATRITVDYQLGFLYAFTGQVIYCYEILISKLAVPSTPTKTPIEQSFYTTLNLTQAQQAVLFYIDNVITPINTAIDYSFAFIFSSPLAIFFLSTLNYFSLSSLYILLNIRVPQEIFNYFGPLFESIQNSPLNYVDFLANWSALSDQKVTDPRAIYFGVSSDIYSKSYLDLMIITANIIIIELLILLSGKKFLNLPKMHNVITSERTGIYWGLLISHMINFILPWRFSINGGVMNFVTKVNLGIQYLALCILVVFIIFSLMEEVRNAKKAGKKHYLKISMRNWWVSYQNFIYPFLVINNSPYYFLVIIGLSQLIYFINSLTVPHLKAFAIMKALYPILFHACFVVFLLSSDHLVLSYTTIFCLGVFLLGSMHYLIQFVIKSAQAIYNAFKQLCSKGSQNQVSDIKENNKQAEKKKKSQKSIDEQTIIIKDGQSRHPTYLMKLVNFGKLRSQGKAKKSKNQIQINNNLRNCQTTDSEKKHRKKVQIKLPEDMSNFDERGQKDHTDMINLSQSSKMSNLAMKRKIKSVKNPKSLMKTVTVGK